MAKPHNKYPFYKLVATGLGAAMCGLETCLNAQYFARLDGWASPMVFMVAIASIGAAGLLPITARLQKAE
jgi:hypothetical protein